jgi:hypothetical protein
MGLSRAAISAFFLVTVVAAPLSAQSPMDLAEAWTLDHQLSQFPTEIGFSAGFIAPFVPQGDAGRRGRDGRRGAGALNAPLAAPETAEDAQRVRFLTDEARVPYEHLTIGVTPALVTITPDRVPARTIQPGKRDDEVNLGPVTAITNASWEDTGRLVIVYKAENARTVRYTYSVRSTPRQLIVDTEFIEGRAVADKVRRVYTPAKPGESLTAPPSTASGNGTASPSPTPAASPGTVPAAPPPAPEPLDQRPDAALKGLTRLGVVVEDLSADAAKCGLKRDALESAVEKHLADAGLHVEKNLDDDTYLYVNVNTVNASPTLCVSRYDVTLYSHTASKLSYTVSPVLLQVELLHRGGIAGGGPAAHADGVSKGVLEYVDQFASRIANANPH